MSSDVRRALVADADEIAASLAAAFTADPIMSWAVPDDGSRPATLSAMFGFLARHGYLPADASHVVDDRAAALWLPPGTALGEAFWSEHGAGFVAALGGPVERFGALGEAMRSCHPAEPHHYLFAIGVRPGAQGAGLGGRLLEATLAVADERGEPAYLEATSERSRALYERHGFAVTGELRAQDSPPLWPMWRAPSP